MKKFFETLLIALFASICVVAGGVGLVSSCSSDGLSSYIKGPSVDSAQVVDIVRDIINPEFGGVDEVLIYKDFKLSDKEVESTFLGLTDKQLLNISTVILNKGLPLSVKSIYDEYCNGKDIYDNLPGEISATVTEPADTTEATEAPQATPVANPSETSYTSKDTIIDGHRATITTKIEKYE